MKRQDSFLSLLATIALLVVACGPAQAIMRFNVTFDSEAVGGIPMTAVADSNIVNPYLSEFLNNDPVSSSATIVDSYTDTKTGQTMSGHVLLLNQQPPSGTIRTILRVRQGSTPITKGSAVKVIVSLDVLSESAFGLNNYFINLTDSATPEGAVLATALIGAGPNGGTVRLGDGTVYYADTDPAGLGDYYRGISAGKKNHIVIVLDAAQWKWSFYVNGLFYGTFNARSSVTNFDRAVFFLGSTLDAILAVDNFRVDVVAQDCPDQHAIGNGLPGDLDKNCKVNLADFALLAGNWLLCNIPGDSNCLQFGPPAVVATTIYADQVAPGWNATDATDCLRNALNTGATTVVVRNMGQPWQIAPIQLWSGTSDQTLKFETGVVVEAKSGAYAGTSDCLFALVDVNNFTFDGYGATLKMRKAEYPSNSESRMGIKLVGCHDVTVKGLTIKDCGGDGIYVAVGTDLADGRHSQNITIKDVTSDNNNRQGMSIIDANGMTVTNCIFKNTKGTPPQAGVDIEPNYGNNLLKNIVFDGCQFLNNQGANFVLTAYAMRSNNNYPNTLTTTPNAVSVTLKNCSSVGSKYDSAAYPAPMAPGYFVSSFFETGPSNATILFQNCTASDCNGAGLLVSEVKAPGISITVDGGTFGPSLGKMATELGVATSPVTVIGTAVNPAGNYCAAFGGINFINNAKVIDGQNRPALRVTRSGPLKNVTGNIKVQNANGATLSLGTPYAGDTNNTVTVTQIP